MPLAGLTDLLKISVSKNGNKTAKFKQLFKRSKCYDTFKISCVRPYN